MITGGQFKLVLNELIEQAKLCDEYNITRPPLILDRDTYDELIKALKYWAFEEWSGMKVALEVPTPSKLIGFDIVIKEDLHAG